MRNPLLLALLATSLTAVAQNASLYALPVESSAGASRATRSILFDLKAADDTRLRQQPIYIESITIYGPNPETPQKSVERRFADSLNAPVSGAFSMRPVDSSTPCLSLPSTWNNIGSSFVPTSGCPP
jgi:hypothetical protein